MQLNNITKNNRSLYIFNVFNSQTIKSVSCKGNPASVFLVDKLPTLKQHLTFLNTLKDDFKKHAIPEFITFVYISHFNKDCNVGSRLSDKLKSHEYSIRWFSSTSVIKRCGHGTLAAAAFALKILNENDFINNCSPLIFHSDSESLRVKVFKYESDLGIKTYFYSLQLKQEALIESHYKLMFKDKLSIIREAKTKDDDGYIIFELENEIAVKAFKLSRKLINIIDKRALIISAKASNQQYDVVFRYFAPFYGELEDNATGSAASILMPFLKAHCFSHEGFANEDVRTQSFSEIKQLKARLLRCYQASKYGGFFTIDINQDNDNLGAEANSIEIFGQITSKIISY